MIIPGLGPPIGGEGTLIELHWSLSLPILILTTLQLIIAFTNLKFFHLLPHRGENGTTGLVSVLVPARNEEQNISKCLVSLSQQNYPELEILVLDDNSTDSTSSLIKSFAEFDSRIKLLTGEILPEGWIGKNWACHQLALAAKGKFLLFIDADTILSEDVIAASVKEIVHGNVQLLSVMPHRSASCLLERLLYPLVDWATFAWLPLKLAHWKQNAQMSATFGQFILFTRIAYTSIGGHQMVHNNPLDDFELGRLVKKRGFQWRLIRGKNWVRVLPYKGNKEAFLGISRSVFPALNYRVSFLLFLIMFSLFLIFLPLAILIDSVFSNGNDLPVIAISTVSVGNIFISWFIACREFNHSWVFSFCYPVSVAIMIMVGIYSFITYSSGSTYWKGRRLPGKRLRI
ncbi:glycosyltransferase [SAR202 cluster bacterium AD-802-E10_MRT_200m]|nr:glycosyltransferase [SAR202 cluster bacterium AD-802-E10_MRT_200m]